MANLGSLESFRGWEASTPLPKTEASVSFPTEALFLQRFSPNHCYPRNLARPLRLKSSPGPELSLSGFL